VDLPGHASAILASYPGLGCTGGPYRVEDRFGICEDVLCAGNDGIFDLAEKIFDSLAEFFPSPWVHIGGDEVPSRRWEDCPKCRSRIAEAGLSNPRELQSWITAKLVRMLGERGKTAIGWDEILEDSGAFPLPPEAAVMSWRGKKGGLEAVRRGHRVVMSSNKDGCYLDYKHRDDPEEPGQLGISGLRQIYETEPGDPSCSPEEAGRILGAQANLWTELIYAGKIAEYMSFPRICALAEALWLPAEGKDYGDFSRRLSAHGGRLDRLDILYHREPESP
jgi:hexosaminidase